MIHLKKAAAIGTCISILFSFSMVCWAKPVPANKKLSLSAFSSIQKVVKATLYKNINGDSDNNREVAGKYDLNGDGKKEDIKISFKSVENGGKTSISVGSKKLPSNSFFGLAGVYVVDLDKNDKYFELAVADSGEDAYVNTYFYRYDKTLKPLGQVLGSFEDNPCFGYGLTAYNIGILTDGYGTLIPRLGVMCYISPKIILSAYKLKNDKIEPEKIDLSNALNKSYTVTSDVRPFFEEMPKKPNGYDLKYKDTDIIQIKKGSKILFKTLSTSMADSMCSTVQLQNKKNGLLYFFVSP